MNQAEVIADRISKLHIFIQEKNVEGVLLRKRRSFAWLTGGKINHIVNTTEAGVADLLIFKDATYCITTKQEAARIKEEEIPEWPGEWQTPEWFEGTEKTIRDLCAGRRIAVDGLPESVGLSNGINYSRELAELSFVLTGWEIQNYRWLANQCARALESTCREIEPGMSELTIQAHLVAKLIPLGINPQVALVATDERVYKYRHPIPTEKKLQDYAMIVLCGEKWGLVANATRFVRFSPLTSELAENRLRLAEIDLAFNLATQPNIAVKEIFYIGVEAYRKEGFGEDWRFLHQGGATGYAAREFLGTLEATERVHVNQAFAWNPAIRGLKSEDTLLVKAEVNEFLTHTGDWVYIGVQRGSITYLRPDILVRY